MEKIIHNEVIPQIFVCVFQMKQFYYRVYVKIWI